MCNDSSPPQVNVCEITDTPEEIYGGGPPEIQVMPGLCTIAPTSTSSTSSSSSSCCSERCSAGLTETNDHARENQ